MATITINAATAGNAQMATLVSDALSKVQTALILVTPSGTYDQSASPSVDVTNVKTAIQNLRRNGKTVTLLSACAGQAAVASGTHYYFSATTVSTADIECEISEVGGSEYANATALPTLSNPLGIIVSFYES
jgi:hypothetical protein